MAGVDVFCTVICIQSHIFHFAYNIEIRVLGTEQIFASVKSLVLSKGCILAQPVLNKIGC